MPPIFPRLVKKGFDISFTYHADAILREDFKEATKELDKVISSIQIPISELVLGGGGEAKNTQRLRISLYAIGWQKVNFRLEKKINDDVTFSQSHEVDHVKYFSSGTIALEIEWNNKDPFFDRDLEIFNRLHSDGAISIGGIITRGKSLQTGLEGALTKFADDHEFDSIDDIQKFGLEPTKRQKNNINRVLSKGSNYSFSEVWAHAFFSDKFGTATTHWEKLFSRLERGVGSPCPIFAIGIPLACINT